MYLLFLLTFLVFTHYYINTLDEKALRNNMRHRVFLYYCYSIKVSAVETTDTLELNVVGVCVSPDSQISQNSLELECVCKGDTCSHSPMSLGLLSKG